MLCPHHEHMINHGQVTIWISKSVQSLTNEARKSNQRVPGVSLSVHFMKCSMNRHERTNVATTQRCNLNRWRVTFPKSKRHTSEASRVWSREAQDDQATCESVSRSRPRYRLHQTPEVGQATVQIILNSARQPCNFVTWSRPSHRANHPPHLAMHQHGTVRINLQARPWAVGTSTRAVARASAGNPQPRFPLNTVGQQPANLASIHPQFLKGRIRQPPCSDQRTDTCSRNLSLSLSLSFSFSLFSLLSSLSLFPLSSFLFPLSSFLFPLSSFLFLFLSLSLSFSLSLSLSLSHSL